ncbi:type II toxin-antitoxin system HicB family antitoxin [Thalassobacillus sp. C254]|uniref:type II toxin-antitoxin system HicB family antitoxin n=1 Tax=Thalassobacillus sp. C254 TaxID=1225341 RepID=UPI0006CFE326|nr:type II toxin-antitoxin system HicB family antitoxin [Thalassobacillus sp. C254]
MNKDLNYYLSLDYTVIYKKVNEKNGKEYYYGKVSELDGCHTTADTLEELLSELEEVKRDYIEIKLEHGDPIPEPMKEDKVELNGKILGCE